MLDKESIDRAAVPTPRSTLHADPCTKAQYQFIENKLN